MRPDRSEHAPPLGLAELIAIALGGMVGGCIFTVLGLSVAIIGAWAPLAIGLGGAMAALAAYSYVKLALFYRDEGATYAFFKRSFPDHDFTTTLIVWWVVFGYISTIALHAFTFASYAIAPFPDDPGMRKLVALAVIAAFAGIHIWSTKGMGRIEDFPAYTRIVILRMVAGVLWGNAETTLPVQAGPSPDIPILGPIGAHLVIVGALLATMSAIPGPLFEASRLISVISRDNFPEMDAPTPAWHPTRRNPVLDRLLRDCSS